MTAEQGSCFGYAIDSRLPFRFLRAGGGREPLRVTTHTESGPAGGEMCLEWFPGDGVALHARLYRDGERFRLWIDTVGWYLIDPTEPSIAVPLDEDPLRREERLWGLPTLLCFIRRGDLSVHAAAVQVGDGALLVGAPSGFGKSTLAAAFWHEGHRVLSDDLTCVRMVDGPSVVPGPALLRLRPDMAERLGVTAMPDALVAPDRVRLRPAGALVGDCDPIPLRGIVLIGEEAESIEMERIPPTEAIPELWQLRFSLPSDADQATCFRNLAALADRVPVWRLTRPRTVESLPRVVGLVAGHA